MKAHNLVIACLLLSSQAILAQWQERPLPRPYSKQELVDGFYAQYVDSQATVGIENMEPLHFATGKGFHKPYGDSYYLCPTEAMHQAGKLQLPPSEFVIYQPNAAGEHWELCWLGALQNADSKENSALRRTLQKRYGSITLPGDTVLVPARWFTGELRYLKNPFVYGNEVVSKWLKTDSVAEGVVLERQENRRYDYWAKTSLSSDIWPIVNRQKGGRILANLDGEYNKEQEKFDTERELILYARDINRSINLELLEYEFSFQKEYAVMLRLDDAGRMGLTPLLPKELTIEDRLLLTTLATAVEAQPAYTFMGYLSARGCFNAIYLKARFAKGRWFFHDYRFE